MFKYKCENSDLQLQNLMRINNSGKDHKELICQYTIFKHYFPEECVPTRSINKSNGGTTYNSDKKTNAIVLNQTESESKPLPQANEDSDSNWGQGSLNDVPVTHNTDPETKFDETHSDSDDALLNKLEKIISADMHNINTTVYNYRYKKLTKRNTRRMKRDFKCSLCNLQLSNRLRYDRHMQRHNGCRFMCEGCAKAFPTKCELNVHQVATHGIGPYLQCNHCSFKAARKITLIEHIRLHTGERPYTCEKCGLTFRRKALYRNHLVYHSEKTFQCSHCPKKFYRHCAMLAHMNNIHERKYLYMCNKCGITYTKNMTVRRHLTEKHGIPREMQGKIPKVRKGSGLDLPVK
ncbi:zinc finger protein 721-like [Manduca sexta]|uniref:zinc finger protein 721-like n=1 Tax=Manduca sexta TaxID=7130 RepID=UPI0018905F0B|nr:zinc finger protein 721-like [Manduca sexta]